MHECMRSKPFGPTKAAVPVIGQGTWHMGESRRARTAEVAALRLGLELGMTHLDTAEMYGRGGAEEVIAEALVGVRREDVFLTSKVLPEHATYGGTRRACEQSLRRLRTDHLDLYLLHWASHVPIGETMRAMEELVDEGKIRLIGVSNFDVAEMRQTMAVLGRERLACNQVLYNLGQRGIERDLVPFCAEHGIAVVGYTPFGRWPGRRSAAAAVLAQVAARHAATPQQVTLAFLTRQPSVFAIPKASDQAHVRANAAAGDLVLTAADVAEIDDAFPAPKRAVPLATG
jgi:diketogulonate reductase-like aldo/keto reductase